MTDRISASLAQLFESHRIVFWYDTARDMRAAFDVVDRRSQIAERRTQIAEMIAAAERARVKTEPTSVPPKVGSEDSYPVKPLTPPVPPKAPSSYVNIRELKPDMAIPLPYPTDESDVNAYLDAMKTTLLAAIADGKKVTI